MGAALALKMEALGMLKGTPALVASVMATALIATGVTGGRTGGVVGELGGVTCVAGLLVLDEAGELKFSDEQLHKKISDRADKVIRLNLVCNGARRCLFFSITSLKGKSCAK